MGYVPPYPPSMVADGDTQRIRAATPVFGSGQWRAMAECANWLIGRGAQIVCAGPAICLTSGIPGGEIPAGSTFSSKHYVRPRSGHVMRIWLISLGTINGTATGSFLDGSDASLGTFSVTGGPESIRATKTFRVRETASDTDHLATLKVDVDAGSTDVYVTGICCYEAPWVSTTAVLSEQTLNTSEPIYDDADAAAMPAVILAASTATTYARRAALFSWQASLPETLVGYVESTSTTFTGTSNVFGVSPTFVTRRVTNGSDQTSVAWAAYVEGVAGAGELKLTMTSGDTVTTAIASGGPTIITGTLLVNTEDMTTLASSGGLQGDARDYMLVEMRRTTATSVKIYGFWVGEDN